MYIFFNIRHVIIIFYNVYFFKIKNRYLLFLFIIIINSNPYSLIKSGQFVT